jgi:CCR4-NOT transcription complex subunit 9
VNIFTEGAHGEPPLLATPSAWTNKTKNNRVHRLLAIPSVKMMPNPPHVYGHHQYGQATADSAWMHQANSHQHHAQAAAAAASAAQQQHYSRIANNHGTVNALGPAAHVQENNANGAVSEENLRTLNYIADLLNENTREAALLELSKKREQVPELALILWHSFGTLLETLRGLSFGEGH